MNLQTTHLDLPELERVARRVGPEGVGFPVLAVDLPLHVGHLRATYEDNVSQIVAKHSHRQTRTHIYTQSQVRVPHSDLGR